MKSRCFVFLLVAWVVTVGGCSHAQGPGVQPNHKVETCINPDEVTRIFLEAVDRGELMVFNIKIDSSMIIPLQVEYIYALEDITPRIKTYKVYSKLKQPLAIPGQQGDGIPRISAIGVVLDYAGNIISTESHIWSEQ